MGTRRICGPGWLLVVAAVLLGAVGGREVLAADAQRVGRAEALAAYKESSELPERVRFAAEARWTVDPLKPPTEGCAQPARAGTATSTFARDGDRFRLSTKTLLKTSVDPAMTLDTQIVAGTTSVGGAEVQCVTDWSRTSPAEPGAGVDEQYRPRNRVTVNTDPAHFARAIRRLGTLRVLDGYPVFGQARHLADVLAESADGRIEAVKDPSDNRPLYLVGGTTPFGKCTLWLDPAAGFQPTRIEFARTGTDLMGEDDRRLSELKVDGVTLVVDRIETTRVGGRSVATACRVTDTRTYTSGEVVRTVSEIRRAGVEPNAKFAVDAFRFTAPNGTPVYFMRDEARKEEHEFRDGTIVPRGAGTSDGK